MYTAPRIIVTIDATEALTNILGQSESICNPLVCP